MDPARPPSGDPSTICRTYHNKRNYDDAPSGSPVTAKTSTDSRQSHGVLGIREEDTNTSCPADFATTENLFHRGSSLRLGTRLVKIMLQRFPKVRILGTGIIRSKTMVTCKIKQLQKCCKTFVKHFCKCFSMLAHVKDRRWFGVK